MSRSKPRFPDYSAPSFKLKITTGDWKRIEKAYGRPLPPALREAIIEKTMLWVRFKDVFSKNQNIANVKRRINRIQKRAQELRAAFRGEQPSHSRNFGDLCIEINFSNDLTGKHLGVNALIGQIISLDAACTGALNYLDRTAINSPTERDVWNTWIRELTGILDKRGLPISARNDSDKQKGNRPSPFVAFIDELQKSLPEKYRRSTQSKFAAARAINRARR
jgi:hypothetical protein